MTDYRGLNDTYVKCERERWRAGKQSLHARKPCADDVSATIIPGRKMSDEP
jgi:hypothetical protein